MPSLREQIIPRRKLLLMMTECGIITSIMLLGTSLEPLTSQPFPWDLADQGLWRGVLSCLTVAILCQASLSYNDLYDWKVSQNRAELPNRLVHSAGYALVMLSCVVFLAPDLLRFPGLRDVGDETWKLILLLGLSFLAIYGWRQGFHWFFYKWNFGERVAILGSGAQARSIAAMIREHPISGFEFVGLVGSTLDHRGIAVGGAPRPVAAELPADMPLLGREIELARICEQHRIARVVVALEERRGTLPISGLLSCRMSGVTIEEREAMYERLSGKIAIESLRPSYLIFGSGFAKHPVASAVKRVVDIVVSSVGLVLALPLCVLATILIKLESRGPVFFRQERVGQDGVPFHIVKFRTMRADAEAQSGPVWARVDDDRVTRVGRVLRLTRIDEIPQMVNVLAGKMSFVGPRPERQFFVESLAREVPYYPLRHTVKPGLTGWAQVNHHYGASLEDATEKLRYDLYYIKNMSPLFDLNIILRTVGVILFGKGAR